jgi:fucose permease
MTAAAAMALPVHAEPTLRLARWATRAQFSALGLMAGAWGAHIPSVKARYDLDEATLSVVLLAAALGAVTSLLFAGRVVAKLGARNAALAAGLVLCTTFGLMLVWPSFMVLLAPAFVFGCAMSLFDVSINTEGSELEHLSGRAIMSNLHGMFAVGAMVGAAAVSAMLAAGWDPAAQLGGLAVLMAAVVAVGTRGMLESHGSGGDAEKATFAWPRGLLLLIGLLILAGMLAEGVMYDWCVLYLKQEVGLTQSVAALGYAAFAGAMAVSRFAGDALRERFSERSLLFTGAALAAVSMAVVLLMRSPAVSFVGYVLMGAGLAPVAPILFNAATRVPGVSRAAAIASVTSIGYSGFMIGPPLIGGLAHAVSLSAALSVVVFGAALLAIGSLKVPDKA